VEERQIKIHDVSFSLDDESVSQISELQDKIKELEQIRSSQQKSRQEFESLLGSAQKQNSIQKQQESPKA
jgi:hypothetical protein